MKAKVALFVLGCSVYGTGLGLVLTDVLLWWVGFAFYCPAGGIIAIAINMRKEETVTLTASPGPPGVPQPVPGGFPGVIQQFAPTPAINIGPLQAMAMQMQAQQETEAREPPEPEGEPRTLVGLTGWRVLSVASMRPLVLVGNAGGHVIGRYAEPAICDQGGEHEVPAWSCGGKAAGCGYYILNDAPAMAIGEPAGFVLAKVSPAGRTVLCETGYRTHRYRLEELWLPPNIVANINIEEAEERFGVPIYTLERMLPDGDRAKEGSHHLHTPGDADPGADEEGAQAGADEGPRA